MLKINYKQTPNSIPQYYHIIELLRGLSENLSERSIAQALNDQGLKTTRGKPFTEAIVNQEINKLRHPSQYKSHLHRSLLAMIAEELVSLPNAAIAFMPRKRGPKALH